MNAATGVLTALPGSPFPSGAQISTIAYATDSNGRLFTGDFNGDAVLRVFTTSAGVPTAVSGSPFASGFDASVAVHGVLHPFGFYIVAGYAFRGVGVYRISGSGAATTLTAVIGSPFASGGPDLELGAILALTEDGTFLVAADPGHRNLTVFRANPATGVLSKVASQPANTLGAEGFVTGFAFVPSLPPFIDDPLTAATSVIRAVHITELRMRIDAVRARYGLGPYSYTDPTLTAGTSVVRAVHIDDLRTALAAVYTALGMPPPSYTDPMLTSGVTVAMAAHIAELRAAVLAIQ